MRIKTKINGIYIEKTITPNSRLIDFLRDDMRLIGTKEGCGEGECGACTVLINGKAVASCLVMSFQIDGKEVETIECSDNITSAIQHAFLKEGAPQCGFCIPGMIMSAKQLLIEKPNVVREDVKEAISGNICRCTGYTLIEDAILLANQKVGGETNEV